jgi:hypothetical protein
VRCLDSKAPESTNGTTSSRIQSTERYSCSVCVEEPCFDYHALVHFSFECIRDYIRLMYLDYDRIPPKGGSHGGDVDFFYATYCVVAIAVLLVSARVPRRCMLPTLTLRSSSVDSTIGYGSKHCQSGMGMKSLKKRYHCPEV